MHGFYHDGEHKMGFVCLLCPEAESSAQSSLFRRRDASFQHKHTMHRAICFRFWEIKSILKYWKLKSWRIKIKLKFIWSHLIIVKIIVARKNNNHSLYNIAFLQKYWPNFWTDKKCIEKFCIILWFLLTIENTDQFFKIAWYYSQVVSYFSQFESRKVDLDIQIYTILFFINSFRFRYNR
jgi:hypothetical protein